MRAKAQVLATEGTEVHGPKVAVDRQVPPPGTPGERLELRATPFKNNPLRGAVYSISCSAFSAAWMHERRSSTVAMRVPMPVVDVTVIIKVASWSVDSMETPGGVSWLSGAVASRMDSAVSGSL